MGAPAKPAKLKLLTGRRPGVDAGGRKVNEGPRFVRDAPEPPTWLDREAKAEWRRVVPELARLKLLSRMTRASLACYCETWSVFVDATKTIHAEGILAEGRSGQVVHPAVKAQMQASAELRRRVRPHPGLRAEGQAGRGAGRRLRLRLVSPLGHRPDPWVLR